MTFTYDIATSKKDKKSNICLLTCHSISDVITLFLSTFLIAHIYSLTNNVADYIFNVGLYEMSLYITMAVFYLIVSPIIQKTNRIWMYRIALMLRAALVVLFVFFGKYFSSMIIVAGALNGASHAFYWGSYNVLRQEMVSRKSMNNFMVYGNAISKAIGIVAPIAIGALIDISTFSQVAIYVAIICVIQIIVSFGVASQKPANSGFSLRGYINRLKTSPAKGKIKHIYLTYITYGLTTIVSSLLTVCVMLQFGSNFSLGAITSIISVVSVIVLVLVNSFTKQGKRSLLFIVCAVMPLSSLLFVFLPSNSTIIIFKLLMDISMIVLNPTLACYRNSNLKEVGLYDCIDEHQCCIELILAASRIISHGLLMLIGLSQSTIIFNVFLVFTSLSYSAGLISLLIYEKKYTVEQNLQTKVEK